MAKTFGDNVEGEWIGFESEFGTSDGACRNVPDYQMPESLLDWGVVLTGYEHLTSTAVVDGKLKIRRTRLLPAVGCAIDSVPYDLYEKESEVGDDSTGAFFEDGSFSVGPHKLGQYNLSLSLSLSHTHTHTHTLRAHATIEWRHNAIPRHQTLHPFNERTPPPPNFEQAVSATRPVGSYA